MKFHYAAFVRLSIETHVTQHKIPCFICILTYFVNVSIYVKSLGTKYPKGFFYDQYFICDESSISRICIIYTPFLFSPSYTQQLIPNYHLNLLWGYFPSNRNLTNASVSSHGCNICDDLPGICLFCVSILFLRFFCPIILFHNTCDIICPGRRKRYP